MLIWTGEPHVYRPRFQPSRCKPVTSYRCPRFLWRAVWTLYIALAIWTFLRALDFAWRVAR